MILNAHQFSGVDEDEAGRRRSRWSQNDSVQAMPLEVPWYLSVLLPKPTEVPTASSGEFLTAESTKIMVNQTGHILRLDFLYILYYSA